MSGEGNFNLRWWTRWNGEVHRNLVWGGKYRRRCLDKIEFEKAKEWKMRGKESRRRRGEKRDLGGEGVGR